MTGSWPLSQRLELIIVYTGNGGRGWITRVQVQFFELENTKYVRIFVLFCQQFTTDSDLFSTTHTTWRELRLASDNSVCMQMIGVLTVVSRSRWLLPVPDEQLFAFPQDDASLRQLYPSTTHTHTHTHNTYTHTQTYRHRHTYTHTCTKKIYKRVSLPRSGIDDCLTQQGNRQPTSIPH